MALRVPELEFVDPFGGANDLAKGVLRTPVDPRQSFDDDSAAHDARRTFRGATGLPYRTGNR